MNEEPDLGQRMRLRAALADLRYELIPLKGVEEAAGELPAGATVTVTASPTKGLDPTVDLAEALHERGFRVVPHLAARLIAGSKHLASVADRLSSSGISSIFVVAGDGEPVGPFFDSVQLLAALRDLEVPLDVGVTGYPEGHPKIDDASLDQALLAKQGRASHVVTQMCFDAAAVGRWLGHIHDIGVTLPVYAGIPGVVSAPRLVRIAARIGVGDSRRFLEGRTSLVGTMVRLGRYAPGVLVKSLASLLVDASAGLVGFHVFTFNETAATEEWRREAIESLER